LRSERRAAAQRFQRYCKAGAERLHSDRRDIAKQRFRSYFAAISQRFHSYLAAIAQLFRSYFAAISQLFRSYFAAISQLSRSDCTAISQLFRSYFAAISQRLRSYFAAISQRLHSYRTAITQLFRSYFAAIAQLSRSDCAAISQLFRSGMYAHHLCEDLDKITPTDDAVANRVRAIEYKRICVDTPMDECNEFEMEKDANLEEYIKTLEFKRVFIGILIQSYIGFVEEKPGVLNSNRMSLSRVVVMYLEQMRV
jgi:Uri superfamily endonuclease